MKPRHVETRGIGGREFGVDVVSWTCVQRAFGGGHTAASRTLLETRLPPMRSWLSSTSSSFSWRSSFLVWQSSPATVASRFSGSIGTIAGVSFLSFRSFRRPLVSFSAIARTNDRRDDDGGAVSIAMTKTPTTPVAGLQKFEPADRFRRKNETSDDDTRTHDEKIHIRTRRSLPTTATTAEPIVPRSLSDLVRRSRVVRMSRGRSKFCIPRDFGFSRSRFVLCKSRAQRDNNRETERHRHHRQTSTSPTSSKIGRR